MRRSVLIAESLRQADLSARVDRAWRRLSSESWADESGGEVRYVDSVRRLDGYAPGTIVYLGYGWERCRGISPGLLAERRFVVQAIEYGR